MSSHPVAPRARPGAVARVLRTFFAVVFILALAACPPPFAALGAVLARRPERRTDAIVMMLRKW